MRIVGKNAPYGRDMQVSKTELTRLIQMLEEISKKDRRPGFSSGEALAASRLLWSVRMLPSEASVVPARSLSRLLAKLKQIRKKMPADEKRCTSVSAHRYGLAHQGATAAKAGVPGAYAFDDPRSPFSSDRIVCIREHSALLAFDNHWGDIDVDLLSYVKPGRDPQSVMSFIYVKPGRDPQSVMPFMAPSRPSPENVVLLPHPCGPNVISSD